MRCSTTSALPAGCSASPVLASRHTLGFQIIAAPLGPTRGGIPIWFLNAGPRPEASQIVAATHTLVPHPDSHKPMQHMEFIKSAANRQRYWARSFVGWQYFSRARPNPAHEALASLEAAGWLRGGLITQNVDGLHVAAGSHSCLHLHGRIDTVECQMCGDLSPRAELQDRLAEANAAWARARSLDDPAASTPTELRADGDLELTDADVNGFAVPSCVRCGDGMLKPHVTFFGGSVPRESVEGAAVAVARADALLVVGSSLQTFSAFRLARAAAQEGQAHRPPQRGADARGRAGARAAPCAVRRGGGAAAAGRDARLPAARSDSRGAPRALEWHRGVRVTGRKAPPLPRPPSFSRCGCLQCLITVCIASEDMCYTWASRLAVL
eukprot:Transcript_17599.p1 GENE.Transcript_17599~~Transcript_17599.p1  ORF type:complete len:419 (-),score=22.93 Transcript_17599:395-1540(-)